VEAGGGGEEAAGYLCHWCGSCSLSLFQNVDDTRQILLKTLGYSILVPREWLFWDVEDYVIQVRDLFDAAIQRKFRRSDPAIHQ
jgi:hypothetical protein